MIIYSKIKNSSYYNSEQMKKGYYLNSVVYGKNNMYPVIYNSENIISMVKAESNGWYINAQI